MSPETATHRVDNNAAIVNSFADLMFVAMEDSDDDTDWRISSAEHILGKIQVEVSLLRSAIVSRQASLVRQHAVRLGVAASRLAYLRGDLRC